SKGINHLTSAPYTPEQNPFSKRGNQTIVNKSRFLLHDSGLDLTYWEEEENTYAYLESLTTHKSLSFETLFFKCFSETPSLKFLRPFGCEEIYLDKFPKDKFSSREMEGVFLGYGEGHQMFRILDLETALKPPFKHQNMWSSVPLIKKKMTGIKINLSLLFANTRVTIGPPNQWTTPRKSQVTLILPGYLLTTVEPNIQLTSPKLINQIQNLTLKIHIILMLRNGWLLLTMNFPT
ncbi:hypothetical protein O181_078556, partial [Austropuccinia psidii MF-1]|nr:hypothetical protein [Austropuccinia psidii MF-1]